MQGPSQPRPGRRAGDPSGPSGSQDGNLKDWQKNTWFGPAPLNSNPFEEPEDAPELLEQRSSNVKDRSGSFWNDQQTGYQYSNQSDSKKAGARTAAALEERERRISFRTVRILVLLLVTAAAVLYFGVFRIREIRVTGNSDISAADIIRFSGIRRGDSILRLSETETERRLLSSATSAAAQGNFNYYRLEFRYLEKEMPGTVTIAVREKEACCWLTWCGILYVMDKNGTVLYETEDSGMRDRVKLVEVKGLDIRSGAQAGQTLVMASASQELLFRDLFMEMKVLGCTDRIREADLSNLSSILLTTRDPSFTVALGDSSSIHAKLRSTLLVMDKLEEMGYTGGSINVANPETPSFSPSSPQ